MGPILLSSINEAYTALMFNKEITYEFENINECGESSAFVDMDMLSRQQSEEMVKI